MDFEENHGIEFEYKYDFIDGEFKEVNILTSEQEENIRDKIREVLEEDFTVKVSVPFDEIIVKRYNSDWSYVFSYKLEDNNFDVTDDMVGCIKTIVKNNIKNRKNKK